MRTFILVCLAMCTLAVPVKAQDLRPLPPLLLSLSDGANALRNSEGRELGRQLDTIRERSGIRIVVLIEETTAPEDIAEYTERLGRRWRAERPLDAENAVYVVLATRDRALRIAARGGRAFLKDWGQDPELTRSIQPLLRDSRYFDALTILVAYIEAKVNLRAKRSMAASAGSTG